MSARYIVRVGGEPDENAVECDDPGYASDVAWKLAEDIADMDGFDTSDLDEYGGEGEDSWGVCPPDSTGAYYPTIKRIA